MKKQSKGRKPAKQRKGKSDALKVSGWLGMAFVWLLGVIIYANSFDCSFHFDDLNNIVDNTAIKDFSDWERIWNLQPTRFITNLTFAANIHFGGMEVGGFHLVNVLIHLINATLVYWFTVLLFSTPALKGSKIAHAKILIGLSAAALFVAHPLATQSVTYIVQRLAALVSLFYLLSVCLYLKGRLDSQKKLMYYAGAFVAGLLAILSKENAFTLPLAIVLVEVFVFHEKKKLNLKGYPMLLAMGAIAILMGVIMFQFSLSIFDPLPPSQGNEITVTPWNYFMTQWSVIVKYIQLLIIPVNLNVDYYYPIATSMAEVRTFGSLLILLCLCIGGMILYKKHRLISFGIFWFFLTLAIESSFVPINDVIFEHRTYLPSVGFFLIVVSVIYGFLLEKNRKLALGLVLALAGIFAILSHQRNKVWKTNLTLWNDVIKKSPEKARPYFNRGLAHDAAGDFNASIADYTSAIAINQAYANAWSNRGLAHLRIGQLDNAIADNLKAAEIKPSFAPAYDNLGLAYDESGQYAKAIEAYTKAIELNPSNPGTYSNRGITYGKLGQWDLSIADFDKALSLNPGYQEAINNRATAVRLMQEAGG